MMLFYFHTRFSHFQSSSMGPSRQHPLVVKNGHKLLFPQNLFSHIFLWKFIAYHNHSPYPTHTSTIGKQNEFNICMYIPKTYIYHLPPNKVFFWGGGGCMGIMLSFCCSVCAIIIWSLYFLWRNIESSGLLERKVHNVCPVYIFLMEYNIESSYFAYRLLMTWKCVMNLTQGIKVIVKKLHNFCLGKILRWKKKRG